MDFEEIGINWIFKFFFYHLKKNCSEGKDYPGTELERETNWDSFFFEFLFGIAEKKGTDEKGYMRKGKKISRKGEKISKKGKKNQ